jgi:tRNA pseudouridine38-40 synthase
MNEALSILLRENVETVGAGRTDTGVHASAMTAHFDTNAEVNEINLVDKLNRLLPQDIAVSQIKRVADDVHARFDAVARTYHYHVYTGKDPFLRHYATRLYYTPDYDLMNLAAEQLLQYTDFTSFSKLHSDAKTNICHVEYARWVQVAPNHWRFEIKADRFLRNMVRAIVGTLLEVGRGRLTLIDFSKVIESKSRNSAGESVPAKGLSLVAVDYPTNKV